MAINKEYIYNYLGDNLMKDIYQEFFKNIELAYQIDLDHNTIDPETTIKKYIDNYIFGDMGFQYADSYDELDDFLLKRLGIRYEYLRNMYNVFYEYVCNRFPSYDIPSLQQVILDKAFWKPLEKYVYEVKK